MPLVTLSLEARRTREQKHQRADAVYEALRAAIQIPENDRFLAIREHAAGDLIADFDYLGVARSGCATGLVHAEDPLIVGHENDAADWSFGNGVAQYVEREQKQGEQKEASQKQGQPMRAARMSEVGRSKC